jgi:glutaconate CoA-transferase subunit A
VKLAALAEVASLVRNGMSIGIGGFGLDRKPLTLVNALIERGVRDLELQVYAGGLEVERLVQANAIRRIAFTHVGLDQFGLAPAFRAARESGRIEAEEWSEWSMLVAWRAAAERVSFATVAIDAATELFRVNPSLQHLRCPFTGVDTALVKAPKIELALLHAEAAHPDGWVINGGDEYADIVLARGAAVTVVTAERVIDDAELERRWRDVQIIDSLVDHVVLVPGGAQPGSCAPSYGVDSQAIAACLAAGRP